MPGWSWPPARSQLAPAPSSPRLSSELRQVALQGGLERHVGQRSQVGTLEIPRDGGRAPARQRLGAPNVDSGRPQEPRSASPEGLAPRFSIPLASRSARCRRAAPALTVATTVALAGTGPVAVGNN
eukprot:13096870-Alexandrium_andersonii.AAC.1